MQNSGAVSKEAARHIAIWLFIMCGLVAAMVIVGGATRLTDSGLSITEWRPVTGAIPPLNEADWLDEFEKYKQIPEYTEVNFNMDLEAFKVIYWWEWGHRQLGAVNWARLFCTVCWLSCFSTGFARLGRFDCSACSYWAGRKGHLAGGWWPLGLSERIDVSQYRLAAHLAMAFTLFALMLWQALSLWGTAIERVNARLQTLIFGFIALLSVQIILGAFVAGLRAGRTFNSWPLMDGRFFPRGYFHESPGLNDLFETIAAVQFNHRIGAYIVVAAGIYVWWQFRQTDLRKRANMLLSILALQFVLGIWTVIAAVPISLGILHQAGALALLGAAIYLAHGARKT